MLPVYAPGPSRGRSASSLHVDIWTCISPQACSVTRQADGEDLLSNPRISMVCNRRPYYIEPGLALATHGGVPLPPLCIARFACHHIDR